jgi:AcrR family transcriptional regulator
MAFLEPTIRPPVQRRSRASLERVLRAGFEVLRDRGVPGFTVNEVSRRSGVSVGAIYGRVPSRDALIVAIYEHAMGEMAANTGLERAFQEHATARENVEAVVVSTAEGMLAHREVLRVFMREAPAYAAIWERGAERSQAAAEQFARVLLRQRREFRHPDPELAVDVAWRMLYCTIARRIIYGPVFESARVVDDENLIRELARAIAGYLV